MEIVGIDHLLSYLEEINYDCLRWGRFASREVSCQGDLLWIVNGMDEEKLSDLCDGLYERLEDYNKYFDVVLKGTKRSSDKPILRCKILMIAYQVVAAESIVRRMIRDTKRYKDGRVILNLSAPTHLGYAGHFKEVEEAKEGIICNGVIYIKPEILTEIDMIKITRDFNGMLGIYNLLCPIIDNKLTDFRSKIKEMVNYLNRYAPEPGCPKERN